VQSCVRLADVRVRSGKDDWGGEEGLRSMNLGSRERVIIDRVTSELRKLFATQKTSR
jgi:hypothetical protein